MAHQTITREEALDDTWCSNCMNLGIPDPTIIKGQEYIKVRIRRNVPKFRVRMTIVCLDCWADGEIAENL